MIAVRNTFFIAGYGPLQRSHQGTIMRLQVMVQAMDHFSVGTWEGDTQTKVGTTGRTSRLLDQSGPRADSVKNSI